MARVSVVVVTYNGEPWIRQCLESLRDSKAPLQVIVVDNASHDATTEIIRNDFPEVDLICSSVNGGFGAGNNIGIRRAASLSTPYVFLLNQDAYVTPDTITHLLDFMDGHAGFGVVSPLHCSPDLEHIDWKTYRGYFRDHAADMLCEALLGHPRPYYKTYGVNAAAWLVRMDVFERVGGFDPIFFMYGEDDDLLARFELHGISFALLPQARFVHLRATAGPSGSPGFWRSVVQGALKDRAMLVRSVKRSDFGLGHTLLVLLAKGAIQPVSDFLVDRNITNLIASFLALFQTVAVLGTIRRHVHLCATAGPHFL